MSHNKLYGSCGATFHNMAMIFLLGPSVVANGITEKRSSNLQAQESTLKLPIVHGRIPKLRISALMAFASVISHTVLLKYCYLAHPSRTSHCHFPPFVYY
ncbi:hypothetical protein CRM22_010372 [Opisthorchis felineus]|uniref:Uncharacterized protein n=1 Tax=Opisthorchis felineus TaxID=147828 RepID=A0A4S2L4Y7_OPIFE|nr:hypothetical protein CRM22_010372 [Opisthorchis felineus]